jgi:hypothetical protein
VWGRGEMLTGFWWGNLKERDHVENPGIDGRIILKWTLEKWDGRMYWISLAQDRDRWWAVVNAVMNLRFQRRIGLFERRYLFKFLTILYIECKIPHAA